ncbi:helix-turn-helix transcriptional regulator [Streptomyces sp. NPDC056632]|uniref:helix-turn-helix transcriptional regulator n=1 Tax=Streptomyces sp. NPDC056632 TaxID=3345884 RepID=UPI003698E11B
MTEESSRAPDWDALLDRLPVAWWETDRDLRVLRIGGGSAEAVLGAGGGVTSTPEPGMEHRDGAPAHDPAPHARALAGETVRWRARSQGRLLDVAAGPRRAEDAHPGGHAEGVRAVAVDVSLGVYERERYLALAAYLPGAAFIRDAAGRHLWVNDAYAQLYGTVPSELTGRTLEQLLPPPEVARVRRLDEQILVGHRPLRHALTLARERGPVRLVGHRFPLETAEGRCVGGIYLDVTGHLKALDDKTAVEEELRALRDRTGAAVVRFTPAGRIEHATPGAAMLLRTTVARLEGRTVRDLVAPSQDTDRLMRQWRDLVRGRALRRSTRLACRTGSGGRRLLRADLAVLRADCRPNGILALMTPVGVEHQHAAELTPVQEQVLLRLARGQTNTRIAQDLGVSRQALDYHLRRLREELDAPSRSAAVARGYALGLLDGTVWPPELSGAFRKQNTR